VIPAAVAVVGRGRVGHSLARALAASGITVTSLGRQRDAWPAAIRTADLVLVAVPDDAIADVAAALAASEAVSPRQVVLHCAGSRDRGALVALEPTGAALGSFHPLQTFRDPAGDPALLRRAPVVVEGDARAIAAAHALADVLQVPSVHVVPSAGKIAYHAAAVTASNHLVVLAEMAARLAREAGLDVTAALFAPIMAETVRGLAEADPAAVLTGPVRRGDVGTVAAHLAVLDGGAREAYVALARGAVELAVREGLAPEAAQQLRDLLGGPA